MLNQDQQIFDQIKKAQNILITFNKEWNGDAVASALAMGILLKKLNKKFDIIAEKIDQKNVFDFLPGASMIGTEIENLRKFIISLDTTNAKINKVKYRNEANSLDFVIYPKDGFFSQNDIKSRSGEFRYDLIITLDTSDLESLGGIFEKDTEFFYQVPIVNIDHHSNNEGYGQINKTEITSIATSEIIFNLLTSYSRELIDENMATCLLAGIISKTRNYKTKSITPQVLSVSSDLISLGARREQIVKKLYRSRSLNILKLWGRVLARLASSSDNKIVWSVLNENDFARTNTKEDDISDVIDELIVNIPQSKIVVIIYETKINEQVATKILVHAMKNFNALDLIKKYSPSGTKNYAKALIKTDVQNAEKEVVSEIRNKHAKILKNI